MPHRHLVLTQSHRGCGIGTALFTAAEAEARRQRRRRLDLSCGDRRADAHAFYQPLGFERIAPIHQTAARQLSVSAAGIGERQQTAVIEPE